MRGCDQGLCETVDLLAVIVEVVFAHNLGAVGLQHAGHRVADGGPTGAADVNRAGRVGGDELQVERLAAEVRVLAVACAIGQHLVDHRGGGGGIQRDVDEAGPRHLDGRDAVGGGQPLGEQLGQIARLHAGLLGQLHGGVGGPIAVRAILRAHHGEFGGFRNQIVGQGTGFSGGDQIVGNGFNQFTKRFRTHSP